MADMKWIPVTERLPEVSGKYLVTLVFKDIAPAILDTDFWFFDGKHSPYCPELEVDFDRDINFIQLPEGYTGWCRYSGYDDLGSFVKPWEDATVLAWMPYPKPYKKDTPVSNDDDAAHYLLKKHSEMALKELEGAARLFESLHKHPNN